MNLLKTLMSEHNLRKVTHQMYIVCVCVYIYFGIHIYLS